MQDFEHYVKSNYSYPNAAACKITYVMTSKTTVDKASKANVRVYTVTMKLVWCDARGANIATESLKFVNDTIAKTSEKQLKTINPGDTTNKFRAAKSEIVHSLVRTKQEKIDALLEERALLLTYLGTANDVIPHEMKGTLHIEPSGGSAQKTTRTFDM